MNITIKRYFLLVRGCQKGKCPVGGVMNKKEADQLCTVFLAAMSAA